MCMGEVRPDAEKDRKKRAAPLKTGLSAGCTGQHVIQKKRRIFRTMRMLSENPKKACFFSDFAVKYNVHYSVPARQKALIASAMRS